MGLRITHNSTFYTDSFLKNMVEWVVYDTSRNRSVSTAEFNRTSKPHAAWIGNHRMDSPNIRGGDCLCVNVGPFPEAEDRSGWNAHQHRLGLVEDLYAVPNIYVLVLYIARALRTNVGVRQTGLDFYRQPIGKTFLDNASRLIADWRSGPRVR